MSLYAINNYYNELEKIIHYGGSKKETAIRNPFYNLLNDYARSKDLILVAEISTKNKQGKIITPDGTIKDSIRNDWGYWESKDESDDINEEIRKKFSKGYPSDNILFEDSQTAVLYQHGDEVMRVNMRENEELNHVLTRFLQYERPEVHDFREAIEKFKEDIPKVTTAIRNIIESQQKTNGVFREAEHTFLELCKASINPSITADDVKEMMIQHILSADIFNTIFDEPHFHQENNIARELNKVIETFFTGTVRRQTLGSIKHYYDTINARAASIADHHEKQKFLKVVYENFYKGYNPKAADRLGIVYTPNEIVQFMIRSTDYLLHKHFGKTLGDKNVEILDPATGTGTFICDIIDYLPAGKLAHKYKNELHANEVAILPYYIANLNIEYTYKQRTGEYAEFDNLCFVDTLDKSSKNLVQASLYDVSAENASRIKRQNERRISVIIGNPPYNANQQHENDNNKNKVYKEIDKRVKDTFIKNSTAQKTKLYDMYSRFYRWAMDRLSENGVIAFISNRSFIDSRTFDGFRKTIQDDFDFAYIIDTRSDVRANPKIAGTTHNVFGIQAGVAIMFLVKSTHKQLKPNPCMIEYIALDDFWRKEEKLNWFAEKKIEQIEFDNITPDRNNNWFANLDKEWEKFLPICSKEVKYAKSDEAIFKMFSTGVLSSRDEWVYDLKIKNIEPKVKILINGFNNDVERWKQMKLKGNSLKDVSIGSKMKWSDSIRNGVRALKHLNFEDEKIRLVQYRPFAKKYCYFDNVLCNTLASQPSFFFDRTVTNSLITITQIDQVPFTVYSSNNVIDHGIGSRLSQCLPVIYYNKEGNRIDNITDWGLQQFTNNYKDQTITKESIFHYVYAVLHNPAYRKKYELNLKREFPRIPFYDNFWQWAKWGEQLMDLHINYETVDPYNLQLVTSLRGGTTKQSVDSNINEEQIASLPRNRTPKAKLKALKDIGIIQLDENTELHGIPKEAWEYKLGNRSALEWILDQYKEKKPSDPTIAEKFNTYRFADYKEQVIDLLQRVCTVSVETMRIIREMENIKITNLS